MSKITEATLTFTVDESDDTMTVHLDPADVDMETIEESPAVMAAIVARHLVQEHMQKEEE